MINVAEETWDAFQHEARLRINDHIKGRARFMVWYKTGGGEINEIVVEVGEAIEELTDD